MSKYFTFRIFNVMVKRGNILIVDDNKAIRTSLELLLPAFFERVSTLSSPNLLPAALREHPDIDVVLLDMNFHAGINNGNEGMYWLREIKKQKPQVSVVLFTAYGDIELAVAAIKEGANDFIEKPWDNNKLVVTLQNAVALSRSNQKIKELKSMKNDSAGMYWGDSEKMLALRRMVEKVAPTDANVLIVGENGTGKDMLAKELHALSSRRDELLVTVDMGAITENLFESELFGHARGAFTDAKADGSGKFEVANGGTLFLDEIGNIPLYLQSKLLSVLQNRCVVRVGENVPRPVDIRLITATNCDIDMMVGEGKFREDLYYRINSFVLHLPPLRERESDLPELAMLFLERYARKYGKICKAFSSGAVAKMRAHNWPGNIRELQHTVEKAVILCDGTQVTAEDLLIKKTVRFKTAPMDGTIEDMERLMIQNALQENGGNLSEVAVRLGITRQTLYNKMKKYGF